MSKKLEPGMAYDTKKLNKIFAFLSVLFLMCVIWLFIDDYIRPWKGFQLKAMQIKQEKLQQKVSAEEKKINADKVAEIEQKLVEAEKIIAARSEAMEKLEEERAEVRKELKKENIKNGEYNAQVAALTFKYEVAHAHHAPNEKDLFKKLRKYKKLFAESSNRKKGLQAREKAVRKNHAKLIAERTEAEKELKSLVGTKDLLEMALKRTEVNPVFVLRNLPFIDFMDPTIKIQQVVLDNITDDRYFQHVPKVDRCMTCHTFIDQPGYEDQENPFRTHPNLDLMVGANSKHPMKQYGCTTCHGGEGHRVNDFTSIAHTPENDEQAIEWVKKYNWHAPHKVPQPMFKLSQTEAGCIKCHGDVQYISGAETLNEGFSKIEEFGCYGCHKIEGWEHKRKPGPSLEKIASKVSKDFFKNWVWDPFSFNKHSKMPAFFNQTNNSKPEFVKKNIAEVNAIAELIWEKSESYKPFKKYVGGNSTRGKKLIKEVGCMSCHGVEGYADESKEIGAYKGPYLTGTGSKVDADWLVSWLKKPSHYQEDTIMPSFRLTDREANDIAAYLMSLKNKKFERLKFEGLNKEIRDELLVEYFAAFDTIAGAEAKLAKMTDRERTLELGHRSIGKYGCYSCHSIEGFDGRAPIGPELSKIGSKPITQFGFAHEKVAHTRDAWITAHLINPRRWDNGVDKPFKDLVRMPNFNMSQDEAEKITTALLGMVSDHVPLRGVKRLSTNEGVMAEGMKTIEHFNCMGCHSIDGRGGDIAALYQDDPNEGPPMLNGQGHRVQADWFHHFLDNVHTIRPWVKIRMPSFNLSNKQKNDIVAYFQAASDQDTFEDLPQRVSWEPGERAAAVKLFRTLECASCHTEGFNNDTPAAPNLYHAKKRLRPAWIEKWLDNPQGVLEYTTMPAFWLDGESSAPDILGGDSKKQIRALTKYLQEIGKTEYKEPLSKNDR